LPDEEDEDRTATFGGYSIYLESDIVWILLNEGVKIANSLFPDSQFILHPKYRYYYTTIKLYD